MMAAGNHRLVVHCHQYLKNWAFKLLRLTIRNFIPKRPRGLEHHINMAAHRARASIVRDLHTLCTKLFTANLSADSLEKFYRKTAIG